MYVKVCRKIYVYQNTYVHTSIDINGKDINGNDAGSLLGTAYTVTSYILMLNVKGGGTLSTF